MNLVSYQRCTRNGPMVEVEVPSESSDAVYVVLVTDPNAPHEAVCDCRAFQFSKDGTCKHQQQAVDMLCYWTEGDEEVQTPKQRRNKICPRCGHNSTEWTMDYAEVYEGRRRNDRDADS